MKVFTHFAGVGVSNSYLVADEGCNDAILIDPGRFDLPLLKLIEDNDFYIRAAFITHSHDNHHAGIKTLRKIYDARLYGGMSYVRGLPCTEMKDGDRFSVCGLAVEIIQVQGHTSDSVVFRIGHCLFTGDILSAGRVGTTGNSFGRENLVKDINDKIFSLPPELLIFPGHGPATTVRIEKELNSSLEDTE
jgi:glyoxylase-like metal-dependent hydrolase (beta-lactamase superfamily II)